MDMDTHLQDRYGYIRKSQKPNAHGSYYKHAWCVMHVSFCWSIAETCQFKLEVTCTKWMCTVTVTFAVAVHCISLWTVSAIGCTTQSTSVLNVYNYTCIVVLLGWSARIMIHACAQMAANVMNVEMLPRQALNCVMCVSRICTVVY